MYLLPELPYPYDGLEPYIDTHTLKVHHEGHHRKYVEKLNEALPTGGELEKPIDKLITDLESLPEPQRTVVRNNGGGHYNHSLFWTVLSPSGGGEPESGVARKINDSFTSFDGFKEKFTEAAAEHFSNGWCWLVAHPTGELSIKTTKDHDCPLTEGLFPLLVLDLWEHAYYIKHQNRRPDYIDTFWNLTHWPEVERRWKLYSRKD